MAIILPLHYHYIATTWPLHCRHIAIFYFREGNKYRVSVLSLLYQGKGAELDRAAAFSSIGTGGVIKGASMTLAGGSVGGNRRGTVGIVLDGLVPSKKELTTLSRLRFADAVEVIFFHPLFFLYFLLCWVFDALCWKLF